MLFFQQNAGKGGDILGNIISYLKWRGDLKLSEHPFNEVDNLVLCYLSYFDFSGIVPDTNGREEIAIGEAFGVWTTIL